MALPSSGQISLLEIGTEFSDTSPYSISEYVGEVGKTATAGQNVAFSDFYGLSAGTSGNFDAALIYDSKGANVMGFCKVGRWLGTAPLSTVGSISNNDHNGEEIVTIYTTLTLETVGVQLEGNVPESTITSYTVDGVEFTSLAYSYDSGDDTTQWFANWGSLGHLTAGTYSFSITS